MDRKPAPTLRMMIPGWVFVIACVACAGDASETPATDPVTADTGTVDIGTVSITSSECTLDVRDKPIAFGELTLTVVNETSAEAVVQVLMIHDGYSFDELVAHVEEEIRRDEAGEAPLGHPPSSQATIVADTGLLEAGESTSTEVDAGEPGNYAVVCFRHQESAGELRPFAVLGPLEVVP